MERDRQDHRSAAKARPRSEWIMALVQPLADLGVRRLARTGVDPLAIVSLHGLLGFAAALLIAAGGVGWWLAAALLLAKTLLDNMDGGLARATGRVTQMGRYYDTVVDLTVNAALFAALGRHGPGWAALLAFAALTLVLSFDFNLERLYRQQRRLPESAPATEPPVGAPGRVFALVRGIYRALLAPQDRAIEHFDRALFARLYGAPYEAAPPDTRLAWSDLFSTATLVNLGLSSQMLLLAVTLALGRPFWYVWLVLAQLGWLGFVSILRVLRFRRHLETRATSASGPQSRPLPDTGVERPLATVGALVIGPSDRILLIRTHKWRGSWGVPGGKIERGETMLAALRRELHEETGLRLVEVRRGPLQEAIDSPEFHRPAHFLLINFLARSDSEAVVLNDEAQAWRWLDPREALSLPLNRPTRALVQFYLEHGLTTEPVAEVLS